ncbi:MAG: BON domain-containing protein [Chloroflexi bacterium]|nr:BON domain-containing protein [Chloroflexota bacterium]
MVTSISGLSSTIMQALQEDDRTRGAIIDVTASGGVVTLSGDVASETIRMAAEEIARQQPGVVQVINELRVR